VTVLSGRCKGSNFAPFAAFAVDNGPLTDMCRSDVTVLSGRCKGSTKSRRMVTFQVDLQYPEPASSSSSNSNSKASPSPKTMGASGKQCGVCFPVFALGGGVIVGWHCGSGLWILECVQCW
jgi:hypothetical protein